MISTLAATRATTTTRSSARWFFFAVALLLLCGGPARAASVDGVVDCASLTSACFIKGMKVVGLIDAATPDKVAALVAQLHKAADGSGKSVHPFSVELDSPGGSVSAAFAIGRIIRRENIGVTIRFDRFKPGICNSACVLLFAAGVHRSFIEDVSRLGIHRPYLEVPTQNVSPDVVSNEYRQMLQSVRDYLREMNVAEQLADAMFRVGLCGPLDPIGSSAAPWVLFRLSRTADSRCRRNNRMDRQCRSLPTREN
jgi:hypothetical protein